MRHIENRLLAAGLALSLLLGQAAIQPVWASDALGWDLHTVTTPISQGVTVTRSHFWSDTYSDLRTERYVTYTPNADVSPAVAYGDSVLDKAALTAMARTLEAQGKRVVSGVNGDFYVLATGEPLGLVVTDGVVRSSSSYHYAVGFRADGTAFIGKPELNISAVWNGERVAVSGGLNKVRRLRSEGGGLLLLTGDFGETTKNTSPGVDVILRPLTEGVGETVPAEETGLDRELTLSALPRIGARVRCVVEEVVEADGAAAIPQGRFLLTLNGEDDAALLEKLRALEPEDEVLLDITGEDTRWEEAMEALGALYRLLEDGEIPDGLNPEQTARTAVGIREDGSVLFYTIDGKQPGYSVGASCAQVAQRLLELGCVDAVGLDGGGSTTLGLTGPGDEGLTVVNKPAEGTERRVSTALFLTTGLPATGEPAYLQVEPGDALMLSGAELALSADVVDTGYRLMGAAEDVTYEADQYGTVKENIFTAGEMTGTATVTAVQGELAGQTVITVIRTPDRIVVREEKTGRTVGALAVSPNETVDLTAASLWRNLSLVSRDTDYIWACDEAVGTITEEGLFTAGPRTASGGLTVTAGGRTLTIPVNVTGHILPLEDMEGETVPFEASEGMTISPETDPAYVRMGRRSLRIDYAIAEGGSVSLLTGLAIPAGERYVGLWVYGDGSSNSLVAVFTGGDRERMAGVCNLSFTGWKHVLLAVPEEFDALASLRVIYGGGESRQGTIWLDHLTTANEELTDGTPPAIALEISGNRLAASVSDNVDRSFARSAVTAQYDGVPLAGTWDGSRGTLTAELPEQAGAHRITVTAADISGNLGRASYDIPGEPETDFVDMADHWAAPYAQYLYEQGVTTGIRGEDGALYYIADTYITRAEFFTMVARWMRLDLEVYADAQLPFADAGGVPAWARAPLAALYDAGVVRGSLDDGVLNANSLAGISRAEVMTILGRIMERGWPEADLSIFSDGGAVPSWAEGYVGALVGQDAISGYGDGTLRPLASMTRGEVAKVLYALR